MFTFTRSTPVMAIGCFLVFAPLSAFAADTLPPGVFQMNDGAYYQPSTGFQTNDLAEMRQYLGLAATSTAEVVVGDPQAQFPLKKAIDLARLTFKQQIAADPALNGPRTALRDDDVRTVVLAIWNAKTNEIRYQTISKKGSTAKNLKVSDPQVIVVRSNGVNSELRIKDRPNEIVVAVRYPLYLERQISKKKKVYDIQEVVYTPYSQALHVPEMVAYGATWFQQTINKAYDIAAQMKIPSRAFSGKFLHEIADAEAMKVITVVEHVDYAAMKKDPKHELERFYVTLGANEGDSYAYARSSADALGLAQFIPKTYAGFVKRTNLKLNPDFEKGMRDPMNALRVQMAYVDDVLAQLPKDVRAKYFTQREAVHEIIAAAYNTGVARVKKALTVWEENLDTQERLHLKSRARLPLETMQYILKVRYLANMYRTPSTLVAGE